MLRYRTAMAARKALDALGFIDIKSRYSTNRRPKAREIPRAVADASRQVYALPQSPQLFKQMLMVAASIVTTDRQVLPGRRRPARRPPAGITQIDTRRRSRRVEIREMMEGSCASCSASDGRRIAGPVSRS